MISKTLTTLFEGREVKLTLLPGKRSHLEEYAQAYYKEGYSKKEIEEVVISLLWSPLYLGEYRTRVVKKS